MHVEFKEEKRIQDQNENSTIPAERDSFFHLRRIPKGEEFLLGNYSQNHILFIIKGSLLLDDPRTERKIFRRKHMYFLHRREAAFKVIANENLICLDYISEDLLPSINQQRLYRIVSKHALQAQNLEELEIQKPLYHLINNIIYFKKQKVDSKFLFDIKREELLYFFRTLYNEIELTRFFSPFLKDQSEFRADIYSKYLSGDTVKSLADKCFMTTKTLTRHFRKEFQTTPYQWLIKQKAKEIELHLIHHYPVSSKELAKKFNFPSVKAFTTFCDTYNIGSKTINL